MLLLLTNVIPNLSIVGNPTYFEPMFFSWLNIGRIFKCREPREHLCALGGKPDLASNPMAQQLFFSKFFFVYYIFFSTKLTGYDRLLTGKCPGKAGYTLLVCIYNSAPHSAQSKWLYTHNNAGFLFSKTTSKRFRIFQNIL